MNSNKHNNNLPWLLVVVLVGIIVWALSTGNTAISLPGGTSTTTDTSSTTKTDNATSLERVIIIEQTNHQEVNQPSPIPEIVIVTTTPEPLPTATHEPTPTLEPTPLPTAFPRPLEKWAYDWCVVNSCGNPGCDGVCQ